MASRTATVSWLSNFLLFVNQWISCMTRGSKSCLVTCRRNQKSSWIFKQMLRYPFSHDVRRYFMKVFLPGRHRTPDAATQETAFCAACTSEADCSPLPPSEHSFPPCRPPSSGAAHRPPPGMAKETVRVRFWNGLRGIINAVSNEILWSVYRLWTEPARWFGAERDPGRSPASCRWTARQSWVFSLNPRPQISSSFLQMRPLQRKKHGSKYKT